MKLKSVSLGFLLGGIKIWGILIILAMIFVPMLIEKISESFVGSIFLIMIGIIVFIIWFIEKARVKYNDSDNDKE